MKNSKVIINQNAIIMRTSFIIKNMSLFILLAMVFTSSCNKDTEGFAPVNEVESANSENDLSHLKTLQDTLNFLQEEARKLELNTDYLYEIPGPDVFVSGTEKVNVPYFNSNETREVEAQIIDGDLVIEGDIIVASEEEFRRMSSKANSRGVVSTNASERWTDGVIPYVIQPGHTKILDIINATVFVTAQTNLTLVPRTNQTDYVYFKISNRNSSSVGKKGGRQDINLSTRSSMGTAIHEILHAAGIEHEQTRCDRDNYIWVLSSNIQSGREHNFDKECGDDYDDVLNYNFSSIMHYGPEAFAKDDNLYTILPKFRGNFLEWMVNLGSMGQREGLSPIDIFTVNEIYPK